MPTYDRRCSDCDTVYEVSCKISEKSLDMHYCPECMSRTGEWLISSPALSQSSRLMTSKKDSGFKEVLQKISERNPRTSVNEQV